MVDKNRDPVVVIGLGRFGSSLALELARRGTEVLAVDQNPKRVQQLSGYITHVAAADSTDMEALRQLGVPDFYRSVVAYVGRPLGQVRLRRKHGVTIVAVKSPGENFTYATAETELCYGDVIIVSGGVEDVERFAELP